MTRDHRKPMMRLCAAAVPLLMAGCAAPAPKLVAPPVPAPAPSKADWWKRVASPADAARIAHIATAWNAALAGATSHGSAAEVEQEGVLLHPDAALAMPAPSVGSYQCRLVRFGTPARSAPAFERFKPFYCYVQAEEGHLTIVKQTGSERPSGRLWEDDLPTRMIFLGSMAIGEKDAPKAYGDDPPRDMAGVLERIGPFVWRLAVPARAGARLDAYELTPAPDQPK